MGHITNFEKPIKNKGKTFKTNVDLSSMKVASLSHEFGPFIGPNFGYNVDFSANPDGRNGHWFFREFYGS